MTIKILPIILFLLLTIVGAAQKPADQLIPPFTPAGERLESEKQRLSLHEQSLVSQVPFRSVGPVVFGGRVVDFAVNAEDPTKFYVAYASGGLWKTVNNGITFEPLFDNEAVITIGAIAADWKNNIVWIGSGEVNSSRSSYAGIGMFRSDDGGKTWKHKGLVESHHIGRIILHPDNPDILWVAVLGHLYSPNQERGVYKTTDGGQTWKKVLFINQNTGVVDLLMEPGNPDILYAAAWERSRTAWNFEEAGDASGIWKSTDGGETWNLLTNEDSGFPTGKGVGRIGLAASKQNEETILYALLDNQTRRPEEEKEKEKLKKKELKVISKEGFLALEDKKVKQFLKDNHFPSKYTVDTIKQLVRTDKIKPVALVEYVENANSLLFDTEVTGAEVYRSDDGGLTWVKTHSDYIDDLVHSYGYYFGLIGADPNNAGKIYIGGVPFLKSDNGGKTFSSVNDENVHVDHHALWINPRKEGHLILGNDGGINISYDDGKNWFKVQQPEVGQFYTVAVDEADPYHIYGGTQDNGVWKGSKDYKGGFKWQMTGRYPYEMLLGGDGMQIAIDTRDNNTVYTGYQFGNYYKIDAKDGKRERFTPQHDLGERPFRWNWQTPVHLSKHNQDILYMGSQKLHRSLNKGEDWEVISEDLTQGGRKGDVPYGTLTTIHESPLKFGLIYTGSDDGKVFITKDGGVEWHDVSVGLPENYWVSRVQSSGHEASRVYVSLNGYRWDNMASLIYTSEDYGKTWKRIGINLPGEPVNVIKEDPVNADLLYVGTDHGLYCSLDRGGSFMAFSEGLPAAPVHDIAIQAREKDLVAGTHGRSIFVADIEEVQQMVDSILRKELYVFDLKKIKYSAGWGNSGSIWDEPKEPEFFIPVYSNAVDSAVIDVFADSLLLKSWKTGVKKGLNYPEYDLTFDESQKEEYLKWLNDNRPKDAKDEIELEKGERNKKWYLRKGKYQLIVKRGGGEMKKELKVE